MTQPMRELPDAKYGEGKAYEEQQRVAPTVVEQAMPPAPSPSQMAPADQAAPATPMNMIGPLAAPSARPGEPVTAGAPYGAGPSNLGVSPQTLPQRRLSETLQEYAAADPSGTIAQLAWMLSEQNN